MNDDNPPLENLKLSAPALSSLQSNGYLKLHDLSHLSNVQILKLPNVGGQSYRRILAALGRRLAAER